MNTNSLSQKESKKLKKIRETKERQKAKKNLMKSPLNTERPDMSKYPSESGGDAPGEKLEEVSLAAALKQIINEQIDEYIEESEYQGFEFEGKSEKEILPDLSLWLYAINEITK